MALTVTLNISHSKIKTFLTSFWYGTFYQYEYSDLDNGGKAFNC